MDTEENYGVVSDISIVILTLSERIIKKEPRPFIVKDLEINRRE